MLTKAEKIELEKVVTKKIKNLGAGLKRLRKAKGYSNYHKLAYDLDMAHSQYGSYESGKRNLTFKTLIRILTYLKVSLTEYFTVYYEEELDN